MSARVHCANCGWHRRYWRYAAAHRAARQHHCPSPSLPLSVRTRRPNRSVARSATRAQ